MKFLFACVLLLLPLASFAGFEITPGLWETKTTVTAGDVSLPAETDKICWSAQMLNSAEILTRIRTCKMSVNSQTTKKVSGTFDCPKATGTFDWTATTYKEYLGLMTGKTKDGKSSVTRIEGKFLSADCGKVVSAY
jgi:hypothetical protein